MSFDMFLTNFHEGEALPFARKMVEQAFAPFTDQSDSTWWKISDSYGVVQIDNTDQITGFSVNRPPADDHPFWAALLGLMRQTSSVLYWAGEGCAVADESVIQHVPEGMIEGVGEPTVVSSPEEILELIEDA